MKAQYFKFSSKVINSHLTAAFLWIHVRASSSSGGSSSRSAGNGIRGSSSEEAGSFPRKGAGKRGSSGKDATDSGKKAAWIVVYQITRLNRDSGRPELIHVRASLHLSLPLSPSLAVWPRYAKLLPPFSLLIQVPFFSESTAQIKGQQVHVARGKATWIKIDVKKMVSQWFRNPKDNLGLVLHSYDTEGRELAIGRADQETVDSDLQVSSLLLSSSLFPSLLLSLLPSSLFLRLLCPCLLCCRAVLSHPHTL